MLLSFSNMKHCVEVISSDFSNMEHCDKVIIHLNKVGKILVEVNLGEEDSSVSSIANNDQVKFTLFLLESQDIGQCCEIGESSTRQGLDYSPCTR